MSFADDVPPLAEVVKLFRDAFARQFPEVTIGPNYEECFRGAAVHMHLAFVYAATEMDKAPLAPEQSCTS